MSRVFGGCTLAAAVLMIAGCHGTYSVGQPSARLEEAFGKPRKIETTPTKEVYVWFLAQRPDGAPAGFHGCEMEVTVDARSEHVLGYSLSNIGWSKCREVERKIRVAER
jgi:hypothetical protein